MPIIRNLFIDCIHLIVYILFQVSHQDALETQLVLASIIAMTLFYLFHINTYYNKHFMFFLR